MPSRKETAGWRRPVASDGTAGGMRSRGPALAGFFALLLATLPEGGPSLAASGALSLTAASDQARATLARIDTLRVHFRADSALALLAEAVPKAEAARDSALLAALWLRQGEMWASLGRPKQAEPVLDRVRAYAEAKGDTAALCGALRWLSVAIGTQGRAAEARKACERLLSLATARRDRRHQAWALVGLAWNDEVRGRAEEAVHEYRSAIRFFQEDGERRGEAWAANGLGTACTKLGLYEDARRALTAAASQALATGDRMIESMAVNNLGSLEYSLGDPGLAMESFRRTRDIQLRIPNRREATIPALNMALCNLELGRTASAAAQCESLLRECRAEGYGDLEAKVQNQLARLRKLEGRPHQAASLYRQSLRLGDALPLKNRIEALIGLAETLMSLDSLNAALVVLEEGRRYLGDRPLGELRLQVEEARGLGLKEAGRNAEALLALDLVERSAASLGLTSYRLRALTSMGEVYQALGEPDSARLALQEAARTWESDRKVPLDPEWREQRGAAVRSLATAMAVSLLDRRGVSESPTGGPGRERIRVTYDWLQHFKARTLLERLTGPGALDRVLPATATLEILQKKVLRPGELLLDSFLGPERSFLFAVTPDECRIADLPGDSELEVQVGLYLQLLIEPLSAGRPVSDDAVLATGKVLRRRILSGVEDLIASSRRVILIPDGVLNLLPIPEVMDPGDPGWSDRGAEGTEWIRVPSASILSWHRANSVTLPTGPSRILAVAALSGLSGPLPGAMAEVRALQRRHERVATRIFDGDATRTESLEGVLRQAGEFGVLHLASHAHVDDQSPWQSAVCLGPGRTAELRASDITGMKLPVALTVLSGCESARGRIVSGEGVLGLSSAFLSAGSRSVVATLWSVDDRATARLMAYFYDRLALGETVGAALRGAQRATRDDPATRHPYFWAGFVVLGDGDVHVALARRHEVCRTLLLAVLLASVGLFASRWAWVPGRRRAAKGGA